jgi:hypothetical protein
MLLFAPCLFYLKIFLLKLANRHNLRALQIKAAKVFVAGNENVRIRYDS